MPAERDAATVARIAERVGLTPEEVRAVLAAPKLDERVAVAPATAIGEDAPSRAPGAVPGTTAPVGSAARAGAGERVPPAAAWAAAGVALVAMFVFMATTGGFDTRPDGKLAALVTGLVFAGAPCGPRSSRAPAGSPSASSWG